MIGVCQPVDQALPFLSARLVSAVPLAAKVPTAHKEPHAAESADNLDENVSLVHPVALDERKLDVGTPTGDPPRIQGRGLASVGKTSAGPRFFLPAHPVP